MHKSIFANVEILRRMNAMQWNSESIESVLNEFFACFGNQLKSLKFVFNLDGEVQRHAFKNKSAILQPESVVSRLVHHGSTETSVLQIAKQLHSYQPQSQQKISLHHVNDERRSGELYCSTWQEEATTYGSDLVLMDFNAARAI